MASNHSVNRQGDALVFTGALDRTAASLLWKQVSASSMGVQRIVLEQVPTVDSAGLALLAELAARLRADGADVRFEGQPAGFAELCAAYRLTASLEYPVLQV